jgi:hypothetical protein
MNFSTHKSAGARRFGRVRGDAVFEQRAIALKKRAALGLGQVFLVPAREGLRDDLGAA